MTKRIVFSVAALLLVACAALAPFHYVSGQSSHGNRSGSGGTGTVTHSAGNLTLNCVVVGNGSADLKCSANTVDDGTTLSTSDASGILASAGPISSGANGGAAGVAKLFGSGTGSVTLTAPATAGTSTNSVVSTNTFQFPVGAAATPAVTFTGHVTSGLFFTTSHGPTIGDASTPMAVFDSNQGVVVADGNGLLFSPNVDGSSGDTTLSREAANVLGVGAAEVALVRSANPCRLISGASMSVSGTAVTICQWTLPAVAKTWGWQCSGTYTTSTASDTFAIGINAAQAPTSETGNAIIWSAASTQTFGSNTGTSAGALNLLTGASVSTVTSVPWQSSGIIQASATSGTFTITGTLTGTSPSGTVNAGSTCELY
jgi:hypothetical protein